MKEYEFALILTGIEFERFVEVGDLLYEAIGGDSGFSHQGGTYRLDIVREASSLEEAIQSAVAEVKAVEIKVVRAEIEFYD